MNQREAKIKVHHSMHNQLEIYGYASHVQTLMDMQILSREDYEKWRTGRVDYLERVCHVNLNRLTFISKSMQEYARNEKLKESFTIYKMWGKKGIKRPLRFSKSGNEFIEKRYATHFIKEKED